MLLAAFFGALGAESSLAQAVGYHNVVCPPGFSIIAVHVQTANNTIGSLLNKFVAGGAAGPFEGVEIYKWNGATFDTDTGDNEHSGTPTGWDKNGVITLNPGEAAWFNNNRSTNFILTFAGTILQGSLTNEIPGPNQFSMLGSIVPQAGDLVTNLGLTNYNDGDQVYLFNPFTQQYSVYNVNKTLGSAGYLSQWDLPGDPQLQVGQGFWYHTSASGGSINWVRNFMINQ